MLSAPQPDEVVEVFSGDTLEEAMAYAVATLGPDLTVRRARRVRKGVQGLRGKERYEVVAVPAPRVSSDVVGNAFEALLTQAEQAEDAAQPLPVRRTTRPADAHSAPVVLAAVPELTPAPQPVHADELFDQELLPPEPPPAPAPAPAPAAPVAPPTPRAKAAPRPRVPAARQPTKSRAASASTTARRTGRNGWSRKALSDLGLPRYVLAALPANDPRSDLAWVSALTKALASVLPDVDPTAAVVVNGAGLEGVLGIVTAGRKGLTPGTISYGGRTVPATATELALVVRAEVLR